MKKLSRRIIICASLVMCMMTFSKRSESQGGCYGRGGRIGLGGTNYFVCPMGGAYETCWYNCQSD